VKIKGTCSACGREFLAEQVVDAGGSCPWCGLAFQPDYAATLVELLRDAEASGTKTERALELLSDLNPRFTLDESSVVGELRRTTQRLGTRLIGQP
jgi:hypothetical protein